MNQVNRRPLLSKGAKEGLGKGMQYLVITHDRTEVDWAAKGPVLADEARAVCGLLASGKLRNIWFTEDQDAVLLFEEQSAEAVGAIMDNLPLVKELLIEYRIIGLTAYTGFTRL